MVVRAEGFEPTSLAALEPKSSASASSATPAKGSKPKPNTPGGAAYITRFPPCTIEMGNRKLTATAAWRRDPRPAGRVRVAATIPREMMLELGQLSRRRVICGSGAAIGATLFPLSIRAQAPLFRVLT